MKIGFLKKMLPLSEMYDSMTFGNFEKQFMCALFTSFDFFFSCLYSEVTKQKRKIVYVCLVRDLEIKNVFFVLLHLLISTGPIFMFLLLLHFKPSETLNMGN